MRCRPEAAVAGRSAKRVMIRLRWRGTLGRVADARSGLLRGSSRGGPAHDSQQAKHRSGRWRDAASRMIEVLILVTCVAIMLGLVAVTIQLMLRLVADSQARLSSSLMIERLARQLRAGRTRERDAPSWNGRRRGTTAAAQACQLGLEAGHAVTYKLLDDAIARDETLGGKTFGTSRSCCRAAAKPASSWAPPGGRTSVALHVTPSPGPSPRRAAAPARSPGRGGQASPRAKGETGGAQTMITLKTHKPRRGLMVVAVLLCLLVVMLLGAALLKMAPWPARAQPRPGAEASGRMAGRVGARASARSHSRPMRLYRRDLVAERGRSGAGRAGSGVAQPKSRSCRGRHDRRSIAAGAASRRHIRVQADYPPERAAPVAAFARTLTRSRTKERQERRHDQRCRFSISSDSMIVASPTALAGRRRASP